MAIQQITARSLLDSRGVPTVEATVVSDKAIGVAAVPSGKSKGVHEALELRDGDSRWGGQGVTKAVSHVNVELAGVLKGKDLMDQAAIDAAMLAADGTDNKGRMGANAILAVSLACLRAAAAVRGQELWQHVGETSGNAEPTVLPVPFCNVINGGEHADNTLAIQEFMIVPHGFVKFSDALRAASEIFHALHKVLKGRGAATGVGDEGGFAPDLENHAAALDVLLEAIRQAGYEPGTQVSLAMDVAANSFYRDGSYVFEGQGLTADQLVALYDSLLDRYPIVSIEDGLAEDDWQGWERLYQRLGEKVRLVGDDLIVTNLGRIEQALTPQVINCGLIKPNQIGSYSETKQAVELLHSRNLTAMLSHRSGETTDTTIADLAVGWNTGLIKAGSLSRGERVAKYNRLWQIEQQLGGRAVYAGEGFKVS